MEYWSSRTQLCYVTLNPFPRGEGSKIDFFRGTRFSVTPSRRVIEPLRVQMKVTVIIFLTRNIDPTMSNQSGWKVVESRLIKDRNRPLECLCFIWRVNRRIKMFREIISIILDQAAHTLYNLSNWTKRKGGKIHLADTRVCPTWSWSIDEFPIIVHVKAVRRC